MMTRSGSRNTAKQNEKSDPNSQQETCSGDSSDSRVVTEDRVQQIVQSSMQAFQAGMLQSVTEQITMAFTQLNKSTLVNNGQSELQQDIQNNFGRDAPEINSERNNNSHVRTSPDFRSGRSDLSLDRPDRISNIISNWRIKFSGSANDIAIEDFIYRVNCVMQAFKGKISRSEI